MVLLSLLTLGMAAYGIAGCVSSAKAARIERKIESKGDLDVEESFEDILHLHGINKTSDLFLDDKESEEVYVLPEFGYKDCLEYINNQPLTTGADVEKFIEIYNKRRQQDLERRRQYFEDNYLKHKRMYYAELNNSGEIVTFTFRKEHFQFIPLAEHHKLVHDLYHNTFFGQMATRPGKIVYQERMGRKIRVEVWQLNLPNRYGADRYYKACCKKLGYSGIGV